MHDSREFDKLIGFASGVTCCVVAVLVIFAALAMAVIARW